MNTNYERANPCWRSNLMVCGAMLVILFTFFHQKSFSGDGQPSILKKTSMSMREISGLSLKDKNLIAASDRETDLLKTPVKIKTDGTIEFGKSSRVALTPPAGFNFEKNSQWEALNTDASGRNFLLQENSSRVFIFDETGKGEAVIQLSEFTGDKIDKTQLEGMLLMRGGHILVASQDSPLTLIEYGPEGDHAIGLSKDSLLSPAEAFDRQTTGDYRALASWTSEHGACGSADIARAEDGGLLILGKQCEEILYVQALSAQENSFTASYSWSVLKGLKAPSALVYLPGQGFIIGQDRNRLKKNILYLRFPNGTNSPDDTVLPKEIAEVIGH